MQSTSFQHITMIPTESHLCIVTYQLQINLWSTNSAFEALDLNQWKETMNDDDSIIEDATTSSLSYQTMYSLRHQESMEVCSIRSWNNYHWPSSERKYDCCIEYYHMMRVIHIMPYDTDSFQWHCEAISWIVWTEEQVHEE